jgi:hypothetical protein
MEALGGRGSIAPTHSRPRHYMGWVISLTTRSRFTPGERTPDAHCTGGWVGPRAGLDTEVRGKILLPLPGIEPRSPGRPVRNQTLYWLSYPTHCGMHFINFSIFQSLRSQQEVKITKRATVPSVWHNRQIAGARTLAFEQTFTRVLASFSTKCMHALWPCHGSGR